MNEEKIPGVWRTAAILSFILLIGAAPVAADLLPPARYPDLTPARILDLTIQDPACRTKADGIDFLRQPAMRNLVESGELSASIGIVESPMILNGDLYKILYPRSKREYASDERFLQFRFMDLSRNYPQLLSLPLDDRSIDLDWKDDVIVVFNPSSELLLLAVLDDHGEKPIAANAVEFSNCYFGAQISLLAD